MLPIVSVPRATAEAGRAEVGRVTFDLVTPSLCSSVPSGAVAAAWAAWRTARMCVPCVALARRRVPNFSWLAAWSAKREAVDMRCGRFDKSRPDKSKVDQDGVLVKAAAVRDVFVGGGT